MALLYARKEEKMSLTSLFVRTAFSRGDKKRDEGLSTPADIVRYDNIVYGKDPKCQSLDVYRPKKEEGKPLPVIVSVHGGGWVYGSKEVYQFYCMSLAQRGFAVVNFSYRLAPGSKFPAQLRDVNRVFRWVLKNEETYGFDRKHIFAVGDSAGAHLLGLYTCICTNPEYAAHYSFHTPKGFKPAAIALNCGVYQIQISKKKDLTTRLMRDLLPDKGTPLELEQINVLEHITEQFPPTYVMTAYADFVKEQAPLLVHRLEEKNVPHTLCLYGDEQNQLGHVFHCNIKTADARHCNDEECTFFLET